MKVTCEGLRNRYWAMEDDQLLDVATKELTEDARRVLDEVMAFRGISASQVVERAVTNRKVLDAAQLPSWDVVSKAWRCLNQAFLFPMLFLTLVGVLKLTGLLDFFRGAQFMAELGALLFMPLVLYFQIRLLLLVMALKRNTLGWFLVWLFVPLATLIIYLVMWGAVKTLRSGVAASGSGAA